MNSRARVILLLGGLFSCTAPQEQPGASADANSRDRPEVWRWPVHHFEASGQLIMSARADWTGELPTPIRTILKLENPALFPVIVNTGPCGTGLRGFATADTASLPVWDDRPPPNTTCADVALEFVIPPEGEKTLALEELRQQPYESAPPTGSLHLAVVLRDRHGVEHLVPAGEIEVPPRAEAHR